MTSYPPSVSTATLMSSLPNYPLYPNVIRDYTSSIFQSEAARADGVLSHDVSSVLNGHCFYHQNMLCELFDFQIIDQLLKELESHEEEQKKKIQQEEFEKQKAQTNTNVSDSNTLLLQNNTDVGFNGIIHWNNHFKYEDPSFSPTFLLITQILGEYFDLNVLATRLNIYTPTDWKTFHHDSHKYSNGHKEDFTIGVSFGGARALSFLHPPTGATFEFPQSNGDVFAFDSVVNGVFMHGVPRANQSWVSKTTDTEIGPRLSLICWGKRRSFNERNCGKEYAAEMNALEKENNHLNESDKEKDVKDEILFQANNNRYAHYKPPVDKNDKNKIQKLPLTATKDQLIDAPETTPGIPLSEVLRLMKIWQNSQRDIENKQKNNQGYLKRVFSMSKKVTPLLSYWTSFYRQYIVGKNSTAINNHTMKLIQSKYNQVAMNIFLRSTEILLDESQQQITNDNINDDTHTIIHVRSNNTMGNIDSDPLANAALTPRKPKDQLIFGPKGLMVRIGATNKRFELLPQKKFPKLPLKKDINSLEKIESNKNSIANTPINPDDSQSSQQTSIIQPEEISRKETTKKEKKPKKKNANDFF